MSYEISGEKSEMIPTKFPGIDLNLNPDDGIEYEVGISMTSEQKKDMEEFFEDSKDLSNLIESTLINESLHQVSKDLCVATFSGQKPEEIEVDQLEKVFENSKAKFAICNVHLAAYLQNSENLRFYPLEDFTSSRGLIYPLGKYDNKIDIYVDPFMIWQDTRICFAENEFFNFRISSDDLELKEYSFGTKLTAKTKIVKSKPISKVYKIINLNF